MGDKHLLYPVGPEGFESPSTAPLVLTFGDRSLWEGKKDALHAPFRGFLILNEKLHPQL